MAGDYQIALLAEPYVGSSNEVQPTQGLKIYQFSQKGRVKAYIHTKPGCGQVLGGDVNGWHYIWGSKTNNPRGCAVVELAYANDFFICNVGTSLTFETVTHGRDRTSIIDLTLAHGYIYDRIVGWKLNLSSCSSLIHNAVEIETGNSFSNSSSIRYSTFQYNSDKANCGIFKDALHTLMNNTDILERDIGSLNTAGLENLIDDICGVIHRACEESMPAKKGRSLTKHRPLCWTGRSTDLKKEVILLNHRLNRMRRQNLPLDQLAEELRNKKAIYAEELNSCGRERKSSS
ncbi:unnamed protein product [Parnassius mnemosyne]|uniref:Endonuclease/exonuclease/phosphatase domain-containing protein n=1 Tax=Parnassius mnemosyne TaxID=213953 RepID=A0AAV1K6F8_9NEOP